MSQFQTIAHTNLGRGMDTRSALKNIQEGYAEELRNMDTNSAGFVEKRKGWESFIGSVPLRATNIKEDPNGGWIFEFDDSMSFSGITSSPIMGKGEIWNTSLGTRLLTMNSSTTSFINGLSTDTYTAGEIQIYVNDGTAATAAPNGSSGVQADIPGLIGNEISLVFDGVDDVDTAVATWNAVTANANNQVSVTSGGTEVPTAQTVTLSGGANNWVERSVTSGSDMNTGGALDSAVSVSTGQLSYAWLEPKEYYWDSFTNNVYQTLLDGVASTMTNPEGDRQIMVGSALQNSATEYEIVDVDTVTATNSLISSTITSLGPSAVIATYTVDETEIYNKYVKTIASGDWTTVSTTHTEIITQATHGLPNKNLVYQIWEDDGAGTNTLVQLDGFDIAGSGDITLTIEGAAPTNDHLLVIYDVQPDNTELVALSGTSETVTYTTTIDSDFIFFNGYLLSGTGQEEVIATTVTVEGSQVTYTLDLPAGAASADYKIVKIGGNTPVPSITVDQAGEEIADSTPTFCIYGLDPEDITFKNKAGHINSLEEYSSIAQSDVVVGMGGNIFAESTNFTLTSTRPDMRGTADITATQTVTPLFSDAAITSIANNGDNTATYTFSSAQDLTNASGHYVTITKAANSAYNGTFAINAAGTTFSTGQTTITVDIVSSGTFVADAESDSAAEMDVDTFSLTVETGHSFEAGDIITSDHFADYNPVIRSTTATTLLLGGISGTQGVYPGVSLTASRTSNVISLLEADSYIVKGDVLTVSGFDRKFRVTDVTVTATHHKITIDESITVVDSNTTSVKTTVSMASRWLCAEYPEYSTRAPKHFTADYDAQKRLEAAKINDSLFYSDYEGAVMKYDGTELYRAGLVNWQPQTHSYVDVSAVAAQERIAIDSYAAKTVSAASADNIVTVTFTASTMPPQADYYYVTGAAQIHKHKAVAGYNYDATNYTIEFNDTDITASAADGKLWIPLKAGYYFKVNAYDRNDNIVASATTDYRDCVLEILKSGRVYHRLTALPNFAPYHYTRLDLEVYRTKLAESLVTPEFYKIRTIPIHWESYRNEFTIWISDSLGNGSLVTPNDTVSNAVSLQTTGTALERPTSYDEPQIAKYMTSIANRMVQGNIKGYNKVTLRYSTDSDDSFEGINTTIDGDVYEFIKSNDSLRENITTIRPSATGDRIELVHVAAPAPLTVGEWVQIACTDSANNHLEKDAGWGLGWWKVKQADSTTSTYLESGGYGTNLTQAPYSIGTVTPNQQLVMYRASVAGRVPVVSFEKDEMRPFEQTSVLDVTPPFVQSPIDLQRAVNTVQKSKATPSVYAKAGAAYGTGVVELVTPDPAATISVTVDTNGWTSTGTDPIDIFANNILLANAGDSGGEVVTGINLVYPSRILISPERFPETFDNPMAANAIYSNSIVDINADDGQEVTGFSSFLTVSSSTDSQVEATLIVFKSNSVYSVDVNTRAQTRLESAGQGCTIPGSIQATEDGIMFANRSGIYIVTKALEVHYIGQNMEGYWEDTVNENDVEVEAVGLTDGKKRKYYLSVPINSTNTNSEVVVYDYIKNPANGSVGSWGLYDGINVSAWLQTNTETVYGNYGARVFKQRGAGDSSDYRDDTTAITATFQYSPRSFGDSGEEVLLDSFVTHIEEGGTVAVSEALDMSATFTSIDTITYDGVQRSFAVKSTPSNSRILYTQVKYVHNTVSENFKLTGIDFRVAPTNAKAIPEAND